MTIAGPGASNLAISGGDSAVVLIVNAGATAAISGLTIEHGSSLLGGGVFNAGTLTLTGCVISNNTLGNQLGGGIFNAGILSLISSTVSGNQVESSSETFAPSYGGGIYNYQGGTLNLTNTTVSGNSIAGSGNSIGGGIFNGSGGTLTLTNSTISNNAAGLGSGGGIGNLGTVTVTNSAISGNTASAVGGILSQGTLKLVSSTVSGNQASIEDGGISATDCNHASCPVSLINSTISGNSCGSADNPSCGGGAGGITLGCLEVTGCSVALSSTTVSGNSCYGLHPGVGVPCPGGIPSVFASDNGNGKFAVKNVILANNSAGGNCVPQFALFVSDGYNLSDDASCASVFTQTGDLNNTPAGLDPGGLKNNGGPTQTIALLATSPAVNAIPAGACTDASGNPITTDQRGVHRPQGSGCEIGAYEYFQSRFTVQAVQTLLLIDAVQSSPLPQVVQLALNAPLNAAVDSLNRGNSRAAAGQLGAFVILVPVRGLAGGLSQEEADAWTGSATAIIQSLGN